MARGLRSWSTDEACDFVVRKWAAQLRIIASDKVVQRGFRIALRIAGANAGGLGLDINGMAKLNEGDALRKQTDGARRDVAGRRPALPLPLAGASPAGPVKKKRSPKAVEKKRLRWEAHVAKAFAGKAAAAEPLGEDVAMETHTTTAVDAMSAPMAPSPPLQCRNLLLPVRCRS